MFFSFRNKALLGFYRKNVLFWVKKSYDKSRIFVSLLGSRKDFYRIVKKISKSGKLRSSGRCDRKTDHWWNYITCPI